MRVMINIALHGLAAVCAALAVIGDIIAATWDVLVAGRVRKF